MGAGLELNHAEQKNQHVETGVGRKLAQSRAVRRNRVLDFALILRHAYPPSQVTPTDTNNGIP